MGDYIELVARIFSLAMLSAACFVMLRPMVSGYDIDERDTQFAILFICISIALRV